MGKFYLEKKRVMIIVTSHAFLPQKKKGANWMKVKGRKGKKKGKMGSEISVRDQGLCIFQIVLIFFLASWRTKNFCVFYLYFSSIYYMNRIDIWVMDQYVLFFGPSLFFHKFQKPHSSPLVSLLPIFWTT